MRKLLAIVFLATLALAMKKSQPLDLYRLPQCFYLDDGVTKPWPVIPDDCLKIIDVIRDWEKNEQVMPFFSGVAGPSGGFKGEPHADEFSFSELAKSLDLLMHECVSGGYIEQYGGFMVIGHRRRMIAALVAQQLEADDKGRDYYTGSPKRQGSSLRGQKPPRRG